MRCSPSISATTSFPFGLERIITPASRPSSPRTSAIQKSEDLDSEYLNVFETRQGTPFFHDAYVSGVRVQLTIGPPGTGKSVHTNQMLALERKYHGFTFIFDIGNSYESMVELYGGKVDRIGLDGPRVNPFALEPTEKNIKFLYNFVKMLLTNGGADAQPRGRGCGVQRGAGYVPHRPEDPQAQESAAAEAPQPVSRQVDRQGRL